MPNRFWDQQGKYIEGFLKEYEHWVLEVSYRQHTLGCYNIFAKEPVERISASSNEAMVELRDVMANIESALEDNPIFRPDRFNYWQMGNSLHHLHFHGIPRYESPREFAGRQWVDATWGSIPVWSKQEVNHELVRQLKSVMMEGLS